MTNILYVMAGNDFIGSLIKKEKGKLYFSYDEEWLKHPDNYPLSLSMPLQQETYSGISLDLFLKGLMTENEDILNSLEKQNHISANNPFDILKAIGDDCAGAFRFTSKKNSLDLRKPCVKWLTEDELVVKLDQLKNLKLSPKNIPDIFGKFSLSGVQPKLSLIEKEGHFGMPLDGHPSNIILKPRFTLIKGHLENELLCLSLANSIGLSAAKARIVRIGKHNTLVVDRYDRILSDGNIKRIHQEDMCQTLSRPEKYQNAGGPTPLEILSTIKKYSSAPTEDMYRFVDALIFNWLIAGTDAHAKNYSMLIGSKSLVRLAPLYDVASYAGHEDFFPSKTKMAMCIDRKYCFAEIQLRHWEKFIKENKIDLNIKERILKLGKLIQKEIPSVSQMVLSKGGEKEHLLPLVNAISKHNQNCLKRFENNS